MAIKASYIFLKTLSITLDIPLFACDGFAVNQNSPIPAFAKLFFIKKNGKITTELLDKEYSNKIELPTNLTKIKFNNSTEPLYVLPAI